MQPIEKIVVVTKKTPLDQLVERYKSVSQAKFYLEHLGVSFAEYQAVHDAYTASLDLLRRSLPASIPSQVIDRQFLATFVFGAGDLVVTLGPDGLVVNTAKYSGDQPLLALNPDRSRMDGILVPFDVHRAGRCLSSILRGAFTVRRISMAKAELADGQALHALSDLFIGRRTHISARYQIRLGKTLEAHSSSGIIVTTGAGSSGWYRSVVTGASEIVGSVVASDALEEFRDSYRFDWEADYLRFSVREPFISKISAAKTVTGQIDRRRPLRVLSQMPDNGVIFSDGVEEDNLEFNSGSLATISVSERKLKLITKVGVASRRR